MSEIRGQLNEFMEGMHDNGLMDKQTLRDFKSCALPKVKTFTPSQIAGIRKKTKVSQEIFAMHLNTTKSTISKWEQGQCEPNGLALKILNLIKNKGLDSLNY